MEAKKDIKINKVEIQLSDDKISISLDDAKKLFEVLEKLFGTKTVEKVIEKYHDYWYYRPYFYEPYPKPYRWNDIVYCSDTTKQLTGGETLSINLNKYE